MIDLHSPRVNKTIVITCLLSFLTIFTRMWPALYRLVPFGFDHGKDSIAILSMLVTHTPKLIGPWTSIPGVFFGPGWYYLLAPAYLISRGDPVSAVWVMILLSLAQSLLVWRVWGLRAALLVTLAPLYIITSKSAWNPHPMTLISFLLLAMTWRVARSKMLSKRMAFILGLTAGQGFHFSAAFAIFYLPFVFAIPWLFTTKHKLLRSITIVVGTGISFLPQLVFELRHSFVQSSALLKYFAQGEPHSFSIAKITSVLTVTLNEITLGIFPRFDGTASAVSTINAVVAVTMALLISFLFVKWWKQSKHWQRRWLFFVSIFLVLIPIVSYFFLHFNVWYLYGLVPVVTMFVALSLSQASRGIAAIVIATFLVASIWNIQLYLSTELTSHQRSKTMLRSKEKALEYIVATADNSPFSVYVYVPDIYDYSYQYLWFRRAYLGEALPVEFSYKPATADYVSDKSAILGRFPQQHSLTELRFYIIEQPQDSSLYNEWKAMQEWGEVIDEQLIGDGIKIIVTKPSL